MIWNSKIIDFIYKEFGGNPNVFIESPFYKLNSNIRKANLLFELTPMEAKSLEDLKKHPEYLAQYIYDVRQEYSKNNKPIELYEYQLKTLNALKNHRFLMLGAQRQVGVTTILLLLTMNKLLNGESVLYYSSNSTNFVEKIKDLYYKLEFFEKPGVISWNAKSITFDNGAIFNAPAPTKIAALGRTFSTVIFENAEYIKEFDSLYSSIFPMISTSNCIITFNELTETLIKIQKNSNFKIIGLPNDEIKFNTKSEFQLTEKLKQTDSKEINKLDIIAYLDYLCEHIIELQKEIKDLKSK